MELAFQTTAQLVMVDEEAVIFYSIIKKFYDENKRAGFKKIFTKEEQSFLTSLYEQALSFNSKDLDQSNQGQGYQVITPTQI